MSNLVQALNLSVSITHYIFILCLTGVLIAVYFNRKKEFSQGIIGYALFLLTILVFFIFDLYRDIIFLVGFQWVELSLSLLASFFFIATSIKYWKYINNKLFFSNMPFVLGILAIGVLQFINPDASFAIYRSFFTFIATFIAYFIVVSFLINTSGKSNLKKKIDYKGVFMTIFFLSFLLIGLFWSFNVVEGGFFILNLEQEQELSSELNIYNLGEYYPESVYTNFEKEFGVKLNIDYYEEEEAVIKAIRENPGKYDVVTITDGLVKRLVNEGLLAPIDKKNVPNFKNIQDNFINPKYDSLNRHSVPYLFGTTGILINTKYIPEDTDSLEVLWNKNYAGKIGMTASPSEVVGATSKYLGQDLIPKDNFEWNNVRDFLLEQKPLIYDYGDLPVLGEPILLEEIIATQAYDGDALVLMEQSDNLKYFIPKEGGAYWIDTLAIPRDAKNKYNAEIFINYILRQDTLTEISNYTKFISTSKEVEEIRGISLSKEDYEKLELFSDYNLSEEMEAMMNELMEELMEK